jgi:hypothetical protein
MDLLQAQILTEMIVEPLKLATPRLRPDGSNSGGATEDDDEQTSDRRQAGRRAGERSTRSYRCIGHGAQATRSTILPCDLRLAAPGPLGDIP